jgi:predicted dehydrogenase
VLNVAICGLGWWGRIIVPLVRTSAKLRVVRVVDPLPAAAQFAAQEKIAFSQDYEDALRDPAVQAVVLCTPHTLHTGQIIAAA